MLSEVYLCVKYNKLIKNKNNYSCKRFDDFISANTYYRQNVDKHYLESSTMVPDFSYMPEFMKRVYIKYELSNMFGKVDIKDDIVIV